MSGTPTADPPITLAEFESAALDPGTFTHELHVYCAWQMLKVCPPEIAFGRYAAALKRITTKFGATDKYHETITGFFLFLIAERHSTMTNAGWSAFRDSNRDLFDDASALLRQHYSAERLESRLARRQFLLPDRDAVNAA